jgi:hypothetical protein
MTVVGLGWQPLLVAITCLAIQVPLNPFSPPPVVAGAPSVILVGKIQRLQGNQQPGTEPRQEPLAVAGQEVVVVKGRVTPVGFGDPFLPLNRLNAPVITRGLSDADGSFRLPLRELSSDTSEITLFLVVPGGYYLNRFDGSGSFSALNIHQLSDNPLVLTDDRSAVR